MPTKVNLAAPALLVAVPQMGDRNFSRAVVLLLEHDDRGTMGLVLNRASDFTAAELIEGQGLRLGGSKPTPDPVFMGGPVQQDRAFILHSKIFEGPQGEHVMEDLQLSYTTEALRKLALQPPSFMRLYLGYAGWGPGQLGEELGAGAWLVAPAERDLIASAPGELADGLWSKVMDRLGIDPIRLVHSGMIH